MLRLDRKSKKTLDGNPLVKMSRSNCLFVPIDVLMGFHPSPKLLKDVLRVLCLGDEDAFLSCFTWNTRKNVSLSIIDISNFCTISLLNSSQDLCFIDPKLCHRHKFGTRINLLHVLVKRVGSAFLTLKAFKIRISLRHSYHALGACLSS
jgi:hypothetical protein